MLVHKWAFSHAKNQSFSFRTGNIKNENPNEMPQPSRAELRWKAIRSIGKVIRGLLRTCPWN